MSVIDALRVQERMHTCQASQELYNSLKEEQTAVLGFVMDVEAVRPVLLELTNYDTVMFFLTENKLRETAFFSIADLSFYWSFTACVRHCCSAEGENGVCLVCHRS